MKKLILLMLTIVLVGCTAPNNDTSQTTMTTTMASSAPKTGTVSYKMNMDNQEIIQKINYVDNVVKSVDIILTQPLPEEIPSELTEEQKEAIKQLLLAELDKEFKNVEGITKKVTINKDIESVITLDLTKVDFKNFADSEDKGVATLANLFREHITIDLLEEQLREQGAVKID